MSACILYVEHGRLGNQLFAYHAAMTYKNNVNLISFNCNSLTALLSSQTLRNVDLKRPLVQILFKTLCLLARFRILSSLQFQPKNGSFIKRTGLLSEILFLKQSSLIKHGTYHLDDYLLSPLRVEINQKASDYLDILSTDVKTEFCFIHIRRGDYVTWPSRSSPAVLPAEWYLRQYNYVQERYLDLNFIVLSDDIPYAKDLFKNRSNVHFSYESELVDFAIMAQCKHGIISASTYSWWASFYSVKSNLRSATTGLFIAPEGWIKNDLCPFPQASWLQFRP